MSSDSGRLGRSTPRATDPRRGLGRPEFYYTVDQVAGLLSLTPRELNDSYLWREAEDTGIYRPRYLRAVSLQVARTDGGMGREYRIPEGELLRWLTYNDLYLGDPFAELDMYETPLSRAQTEAVQQDYSIPRTPAQ